MLKTRVTEFMFERKLNPTEPKCESRVQCSILFGENIVYTTIF